MKEARWEWKYTNMKYNNISIRMFESRDKVMSKVKVDYGEILFYLTNFNLKDKNILW